MTDLNQTKVERIPEESKDDYEGYDEYEGYDDGWHEMTAEETKEYYDRITKSEGFDAPYFPKVIIYGNIAPVNPLSTCGFDSWKCAQFALAEHNKSEGKNYIFYDVVKANQAVCAGCDYYITFEAEDPDYVTTMVVGDAEEGQNAVGSDSVRLGPSGLPLVTFEAHVFMHLPDEDRNLKMVIHKFRKKHSQIP